MYVPGPDKASKAVAETHRIVAAISHFFGGSQISHAPDRRHQKHGDGIGRAHGATPEKRCPGSVAANRGDEVGVENGREHNRAVAGIGGVKKSPTESFSGTHALFKGVALK